MYVLLVNCVTQYMGIFQSRDQIGSVQLLYVGERLSIDKVKGAQ